MRLPQFSCESIARLGQCGNDRFSVDRCDPTADALYPGAAISAADIGYIDEGTCGQPGHRLAVKVRFLYLCETCGCLSEHEHDLCHALIGCQLQRRGRCGKRIVLLCRQIVGQCAVAAAVDAVDDPLW